MNFDFVKHREQEYLTPIVLEEKEQYFLDLMQIQENWTGRMDVLFCNDFIREAVQMVVHAISLFEMGYFDCAFYSLRQSLELSTTVVYFVDDTESSRQEKIKKWKNIDRFPPHRQMINELINRKQIFADIKEKMSEYFEKVDIVKNKLNKYVHKQGIDKFYIWRKSSLRDTNSNTSLVQDFNESLICSIGAIAVFRLAIDPLPILLMEEAIYNRTGDLLSEGFNNEFIDKYIGKSHIEQYKLTELFRSNYKYLIENEEMTPAVVNVVKHQFVDRSNLNEILRQKHLLNKYDLIAVSLFQYSEKIAHIYFLGGLYWYFSDTRSSRLRTGWSSEDFKRGKDSYNMSYDEAYLSHFTFNEDDFCIEHNSPMTDEEIQFLNILFKSNDQK